jgi:hypothetical protein
VAQQPLQSIFLLNFSPHWLQPRNHANRTDRVLQVIMQRTFKVGTHV